LADEALNELLAATDPSLSPSTSPSPSRESSQQYQDPFPSRESPQHYQMRPSEESTEESPAPSLNPPSESPDKYLDYQYQLQQKEGIQSSHDENYDTLPIDVSKPLTVTITNTDPLNDGFGSLKRSPKSPTNPISPTHNSNLHTTTSSFRSKRVDLKPVKKHIPPTPIPQILAKSIRIVDPLYPLTNVSRISIFNRIKSGNSSIHAYIYM
jgi:hypothetical protein